MKSVKSMNFGLAEEADTQVFAQWLALQLKPPLCFTLSGEIGAGKTTLIRALLRAWGVQGTIRSPTFSMVESYELPHLQAWFHHFDLYRMTSVDELELLGYRDFFTPNSLCCIEWPERAGTELGKVDISMKLEMQTWIEVNPEHQHQFHLGRSLNVQSYSAATDALFNMFIPKGS